MDLHALLGDADLRKKVQIATLVAADTLLSGAPSSSDQKWASAVYANPQGATGEWFKAYGAMLAANNTASIANIEAATDASIQANVDAVADSLVVAFNA